MSRFSPAAVLYGLVGAAYQAVSVVEDGTAYLLRSAAKIAQKADSSLHYVGMNAGGGIRTTLYDGNGNPIAFPVGVTDAGLWVEEPVTNNGSDDLLVDGSSTPVEFTLLADPTKDIALNAIVMVLVSNSLTFGADKFGAVNALANGVEISVTQDGDTGVLGALKQNEGFLHAATPGGFNLLIANKDVISSIISLGGGVVLHAGSSDKVTVKVQDNISSAGDYFKISVQGVKEA